MRRIVTALVTFLVVLVGGSLLSINPASAADSHLITHSCDEIGRSGDYRAVHCADLYFYDSDVAWGEGEVMCLQISTGAYKSCSGIQVRVGVCAGSKCSYGSQGVCGVAYAGHSACPSPRLYYDKSPTVAGCNLSTKGRIIDTVVVLPNGKTLGGVGTSTETSVETLAGAC
jgi:hypothetical protein